jgi:RNA polymerase sigma factor (sigma-70 family)
VDASRRNFAPQHLSHPVNAATPSPNEPEEPLAALLERIRPRIRRLLRNYDIPPHDAEDLLQEAIVDVLRRWDTVYHKESWLLGTIRCKCFLYWKHQRKDRVYAVDPPFLEDLCKPQPPNQEQGEILLYMKALTEKLGKKQQAALWLRFGLGFSTQQVAKCLGYRPSSVRKLNIRSLARLYKLAGLAPPAKPEDDEGSS